MPKEYHLLHCEEESNMVEVKNNFYVTEKNGYGGDHGPPGRRTGEYACHENLGPVHRPLLVQFCDHLK